MSTIARNTVFAIMIALVVGPARADQYWVAYEGNDFPENEGWERHYYAPQPSNRAIVDGALQLDSSASQWTYDFYQVHRMLNPDPGELFVASWRLRVVQTESPFGVGDAGLGIFRDGGGTLSFSFLEDRILSTREGWSFPIEQGVFHEYTVTSSDMLSYTLAIDSVTVSTGVWDLNSLNESYVGFGDTSQGGGVLSIAEWDFIRFGVIPEPSAAVLVGLLLMGFRSMARKGDRP